MGSEHDDNKPIPARFDFDAFLRFSRIEREIIERERAIINTTVQTVDEEMSYQKLASLVAILSFVGFIIVGISVSQAREVVQPVRDIALENRAAIKSLVEDVRNGQNLIIHMLQEQAKK